MSRIEKTFFFCNIIESIIHQGSVSLLTLRQKTKFASKVSVDGAHIFFFFYSGVCLFFVRRMPACVTQRVRARSHRRRETFI